MAWWIFKRRPRPHRRRRCRYCVRQAQQRADVCVSCEARLGGGWISPVERYDSHMTQTPEWAPMVGLRFPGSALVPGESEAVALAASLEIVRRRICCYSDGTVDVRCDCKYGLGAILTDGAVVRPGGEKTGCPELREVIAFLLAAP